jgi:hypothetical protein
MHNITLDHNSLGIIDDGYQKTADCLKLTLEKFGKSTGFTANTGKNPILQGK